MNCPHCEGTGIATQDFEPMVVVRPLPTNQADKINMLRAIDHKLSAWTCVPDNVLEEIIEAIIDLGYMKRGS